MASVSGILGVSGRESTSDLSVAHLNRCARSCAVPELQSLHVAGSIVILNWLRWCCRTSWPVVSQHCVVAVFLAQLLSGPFLNSAHYCIPLGRNSIFFFILKFFADLIFLTALKDRSHIDGGFFVAAGSGKSNGIRSFLSCSGQIVVRWND